MTIEPPKMMPTNKMNSKHMGAKQIYMQLHCAKLKSMGSTKSDDFEMDQNCDNSIKSEDFKTNSNCDIKFFDNNN